MGGQSSSTVPLQFLGGVQGFKPIQAQAVTTVIALGQFLMLPLLALVLDQPKIDARAVSLVGLMMMMAACVGSSFVTIDWQAGQFLLWQAVQAVAQPMVVMPLMLLATNTIRSPEDGPFASALVNTPRGLAEVLGVWLIDLVNRWRGALHYNRIADQLGQERGRMGLPSAGPDLSETVRQQAMVLTVSDLYLVLAAITLALAVVVLVLPVRSLPPRLELAKE